MARSACHVPLAAERLPAGGIRGTDTRGWRGGDRIRGRVDRLDRPVAWPQARPDGGREDRVKRNVGAYAAYQHQLKNPGVTEFVEIPGRGHALTIDDGWQEVAEAALSFVRRFT
jgi:hypothetical protein